LACEHLGRDVTLVSPDGVPDAYRFLPECERIRTAAEEAFDLSIGVDADGSHRLGSAEAAVLAAPRVIDIDHHTGPSPYGDLQLVDPTAAATGELVAALLDELHVPLSRAIADCLMA